MKITKITHREQERIKVDLPYNQHHSDLIRQIPNAQWSKTHTAWHIPDTAEARKKLQSLFPEITCIIQTPEITVLPVGKEAFYAASLVEPKLPIQPKGIDKKWNSIVVEVIGRKIVLKMPKNQADVNFVLTLRYSQWDKQNYFWSIPNYPGNLEMIKNYFGSRITQLTLHEPLEIINKAQNYILQKDEVLVFKTKSKCLKLIFGYIPELSKALKKIPYHTWDSKNKWWSIPYSEQFLEEIKQNIAALQLKLRYEEEPETENRASRVTPYDIPNFRYCPEEYRMKLIELRYSTNTIKLYTGLFEEFINYFPTYDIKTIDETQVIQFLRYLVTERKISTTYQNQSINAIKFYYERVLGGQRKFYFIDRPRKEKTLPSVLSTQEVTAILKVTQNIKHRAILMTIYSAGLRISEAVQLKIKDIDSHRMQIRVQQSKGKKDRYTLLSHKNLEVLRTYFLEYKPTEWLFEGQEVGTPYTTRSIQALFSAAVQKTEITKKVSVHTLRHSFATHLLENGTDLRYIQSLLGHESSKTTEIYTHITTKGFDQIKSPLDTLDL